ncbi:MAG: hypothetical protein WBD58_04745 [Geitlerinemataceae cyanobacterium]
MAAPSLLTRIAMQMLAIVIENTIAKEKNGEKGLTLSKLNSFLLQLK